MSKNLKNQPASLNRKRGKQGGFLEVIVAVVIFLLIMRYYGLTFTGIWAWIENLFWSVW